MRTPGADGARTTTRPSPRSATSTRPTRTSTGSDATAPPDGARGSSAHESGRPAAHSLSHAPLRTPPSSNPRRQCDSPHDATRRHSASCHHTPLAPHRSTSRHSASSRLRPLHTRARRHCATPRTKSASRRHRTPQQGMACLGVTPPHTTPRRHSASAQITSGHVDPLLGVTAAHITTRQIMPILGVTSRHVTTPHGGSRRQPGPPHNRPFLSSLAPGARARCPS
jgi:hypothetical protein